MEEIQFVDTVPQSRIEDEDDEGYPEPGAKIVFLDLEGVVVTHRTILGNALKWKMGNASAEDHSYKGTHGGPSAQENWVNFVDRFAFSQILFACWKHGAKIVLTSTLRSADWILVELKLLAADIVAGSADDFFHMDWRTEHRSSREEEIELWLHKHSAENVTHWAAVDDRMLKLPGHMCHIDQRDGFAYLDYLTLQTMLAHKPYKPEAVFL